MDPRLEGMRARDARVHRTLSHCAGGAKDSCHAVNGSPRMLAQCCSSRCECSGLSLPCLELQLPLRAPTCPRKKRARDKVSRLE